MATPLRFGVHIPTCIEGMMYPVPFAKPEDILPTAQLAERVGFDSVWGNDHMTTQRYVQREWPQPPNFGSTMPPLAKQVATLDQLSGGRVRSEERRAGKERRYRGSPYH